ncbi:MAG: glycosyltransferase family 2 protein [Paramuribaculum sp.]|nr:glycosyltransferase family 2 protein [Paramuribaculum sp.]
MEKKVLVIVVTYNAEKWLNECFSSIPSYDSAIKGLVIDNGSTDGTVEKIKRRCPYIKLIENKKNLGFGAANNIGFRYAIKHGYDYVYLLNQDAWIAPDDILQLVEIAEKNKDFGIISPLQVNREKTKLDKNFSVHLSAQLFNDSVMGLPLNTIYKVRPTGMTQAAHWLLSIETIKKVGGFSPFYFHYGEDGDYCHRLNYLGGEIGVVPMIKGVHDRENRILNDSQKRHLKVQRWKTILSNPNKNTKRAWWETLSLIKGYFYSSPWNACLALKLFIPELFKINYYKRQNRKPGSFLGDL